MQQKTCGIVLSYLKYKESSLIIRVYTQAFGLQSYIVNGVRSAKSKQALSLFQPFSLIEFIAYHKENRTLHRMTDVRCVFLYRTIHSDPQKIQIAFFISELLSKVIQEEDQNERLFFFLQETINQLDEQHTVTECFPVRFLYQLAYLLGFFAEDATAILAELNYTVFSEHLDVQTCRLIDEELFDQTYDYKPLASAQRLNKKAFDLMMCYYQSQIGGLQQLKTLKVFREMVL